MRRLFLTLGCVLSLAVAQAAANGGDLVVVVASKSDVEHLTLDEVTNIYLGRYRQLPNGVAALPIDLSAAAPEKATFYRRLIGKELPEINAYWARLIFSGRTPPPQVARSTEEAISFVTSTPGAIAYIPRAALDRRLKVILDLGAVP